MTSNALSNNNNNKSSRSSPEPLLPPPPSSSSLPSPAAPAEVAQPIKSCIRRRSSTTSSTQDDATSSSMTTPPTSNPKPPPRLHASVFFSHVHIREHGRTVGDNPSVSSGPALDLTWEYYNESMRVLEEYEHHRTFVQPRRAKSSLILQRGERERMLKCDHNVARSEIASAVRSINRVKSNRRQTLNNMKFSKVEEVWERVKRNGRRIFGMKKRTEKEIEDLWENAERNMDRMRMKQSRYGRRSSCSFSASSDGSVSRKGGRKSMSKRDDSSGSNRLANNINNKNKNKETKKTKGGKTLSLDESNHYKRRDIDLHLSRHVKKYDLYGSADNAKEETQDCQHDAVTPTTSNHGWSHGMLYQAQDLDHIFNGMDSYIKDDNDVDNKNVKEQEEQSMQRVCVLFACSDDSNHSSNIKHPSNQPLLSSTRNDYGTKYRNDHGSDSDAITRTTASIDLSASMISGREITIPAGMNVQSNNGSLIRKSSNPIIAVEEEDWIGVDS
mmetsp:Transcript_3295/g.6170  ORF Transcript_3295/g.6170 Transcript_3295/m.6170 type:complete len:499 (+) Transcript_3295:217-1713(+)